MSASKKKNLRKEQAASQMTEKQLHESKEAKKLKTYSITFTVIVLAVVIAAVAILGSTFVQRSGVNEKKTVAAVVEGTELNSVEMSYYYNNAINKTYNKWSSDYGDNIGLFTMMMGLDLSKPLNEQKYAEGDTTWADFFLDQALETAKSDYVLSQKAEAEGYALSEAEQKIIDEDLNQMAEMVKLYGYKNMTEYLRASYGPGSSEESYREYTQRSALATSYIRNHADSLEYDDAAIRAYDDEHRQEFNSYSFVNYFVPASSYLEGGTKDAEGNMTYTDAEKDAAVEKAKAAAEALAQCKTPEELDKAIAAMPINAENEHAVSAKETNILFAHVNTDIRDWVSSTDRKDGEVGVVAAEYVAKGEDDKEVTSINGYYVVIFQGSTENNTHMGNVRHLLVSFQGGTKDDKGVVTYSDEEKAAAKEKAEALLEEWKSGEATEDSFAALVKEKTDDKGSAENGGLFEDINPISSLVAPFKDWALDESRVSGDTGIVETEFGYHIMFYVGNSEMNYRDYMIDNAKRSADLDAWFASIMEPVKGELKDTSRLNLDHIMKPAR